MLKHASDEQNATFERLKVLFNDGQTIKFSLVGAAACREYGLTRDTKDLDIIVSPYAAAMSRLSNDEFQETLEDKDLTGRTCTQIYTKTLVPVDFLEGGILINDGSSELRGGTRIRDPLPIPLPSGFGNVAPLDEVIGMKLSAAISGVRIMRVGADRGIRSTEKINQDIADVRSLITVRNLGRDFPLKNAEVQRIYEIIFDRGEVFNSIS